MKKLKTQASISVTLLWQTDLALRSLQIRVGPVKNWKKDEHEDIEKKADIYGILAKQEI